MVIKDIVKGEEAHKKVYSGLKKLAETVGSTFGPSGRPVSLQRDDGTLHCTKDGVTVAREITFADQVEFSATTYIKDIANNTVARAGDGTTTSILLAWIMYQRARNEKGEALVNVNADFMRGMKDAADFAIKKIREDAIPAKDPEILEKVALIASNNDVEIAELLRDAMKVLGETGNIYVEESKSTKTKMFTSPGMGIMKGFMSNYFVNNPKRLTSELLLPFVLITEDEIHSIFQLNNIFHQMAEYHFGERASKDDERVKLTDMPHILIICKKMKEDVLEWVITQHAYRGIQACVIQADHLGNDNEGIEAWMSDLRLITGCQGIGGKFLRRLGTGSAQCNIGDLGRLKKSVVNKEKSILIPLPSCEQKVKDYCEGLKEQIENEKDEDIRAVLRSRLARLSDGVAILSIGGITEKSVKERADRIEDAVCAVMVAREEGVLPGACSAYIRAAYSFEDWTEPFNNKSYCDGYLLVGEALVSLYRYLLSTAGIVQERKEEDKIIKWGDEYYKPKEWMGFNLRTPEMMVNLWNEGIIEPVKVQIEAIQNSVDITAMLLNTDSFVIYADDQDKKQIYPPKGGYQALMNGLKPEMAIRM